MNYYQDKKIWITGASSGFGKALTTSLLKCGAKIVITARRKELLEEIKEVSPYSEKVIVQPGDMSDLESLDSLSQRAWDAFKGLDIIILNAGVSQRSFFRDIDYQTGVKLFDINFFSQVKIVRKVLPLMEKQGEGHIVSVTSLSGLIGSPLRSYYSSAKHALHGFYDTLRPEVWGSGIKVSLIVPGFLKTDISYHAVTSNGNEYGKMDPLQNAGTPPEKEVTKILKQLKNKKREIYIGYTLNARIAKFLGKYFPGILSVILRKIS
ncbi:MAG: SDR family NAD(P)-dependent oxidoreductase [Spirochaetales bacterium]|nr:SDR family NAD(P)-dependent oxidoreductase [Spirochaetales bacterium]